MTADPTLAKAQAKVVKQAQEIARLTRLVEQLHSDKAGLLFDLNRARAEVRLLKGL